MNNVLIYWIIGCILVGIPMGSYMNDCPQAKISAVEVAATIATWPATLAAAIVLDRSKISKSCPPL